jgi:chorismate mutase
MGAVRDGDSRGLDPTLVSNFFKAQIEANKVIQYSLLADWRRSGRAPAHAPINLSATIRPELDQVQMALIAELADTAAIRASTTCRADVAKAIGKYMFMHKHDVRPLQSTALSLLAARYDSFMAGFPAPLGIYRAFWTSAFKRVPRNK